MGKYTKMALVLLYLLQLMVVFREQLAHLYKTAVHSVHPTESVLSPHEGFRAALRRVVTMSRPSIAHEAIMAATIPTATLGASHDDDDAEHPHHDEDDKKDKAKRWRHSRLREYLIANRWRWMRRAAASPAATGANADAVISALMAACIPSPAAKIS